MELVPVQFMKVHYMSALLTDLQTALRAWVHCMLDMTNSASGFGMQAGRDPVLSEDILRTLQKKTIPGQPLAPLRELFPRSSATAAASTGATTTTRRQRRRPTLNIDIELDDPTPRRPRSDPRRPKRRGQDTKAHASRRRVQQPPPKTRDEESSIITNGGDPDDDDGYTATYDEDDDDDDTDDGGNEPPPAVSPRRRPTTKRRRQQQPRRRRSRRRYSSSTTNERPRYT